MQVLWSPFYSQPHGQNLEGGAGDSVWPATDDLTRFRFTYSQPVASELGVEREEMEGLRELKGGMLEETGAG